MKRSFFILIFLPFSISIFSQKNNLTGIWWGKTSSFENSNLKASKGFQGYIEFNLVQLDSIIKGTTNSYFEKNNASKANCIGTFKNKKIVIQETDMLENNFNSSLICLQTFSLNKTIIEGEEMLKGTYIAKDNKTGKLCDPGYILLKKIKTSKLIEVKK